MMDEIDANRDGSQFTTIIEALEAKFIDAVYVDVNEITYGENKTSFKE